MIIVIFFTSVYQILLNRAYDPLFEHLPVMLDNVITQPGSEKSRQITNGPRNKFWSRFISHQFERLHDRINDFTEKEISMFNGFPKETDSFASIEIQHKALHSNQTVIWIPRDCLGISKKEIEKSHKMASSILISDQNAVMSKTGEVLCRGKPPQQEYLD